MAFDYKKEYKEFYLPPKKPHIITVPPMNFVAVRGKGDPNDPTGDYQAAMEVLYGVGKTENCAAPSGMQKGLTGKFTKDVAFPCEMCYTNIICKTH